MCMRDFLLYISCAKGQCDTEFLGENRIFDVAINDYTESNTNPEQVEYKFSQDQWKFKHIYHNLSNIVFNYKAVGIFDDDVKISTNDLNRLFEIGDKNNWNLWMAALTKDSYSSWAHIYQKPNVPFRETNTMELMMPIFSKSALEKCWDSFDINYSAWGLDLAWFHILKNKIMIVDSIPANHTRPMRGHTRVMPSGLTPLQEADLVFKKYGIAKNYQTY